MGIMVYPPISQNMVSTMVVSAFHQVIVGMVFSTQNKMTKLELIYTEEEPGQVIEFEGRQEEIEGLVVPVILGEQDGEKDEVDGDLDWGEDEYQVEGVVEGEMDEVQYWLSVR